MHDILLLTMGAVGAWLGTRWLAAHPPRIELIAWSIALLLTGALPVVFVAPQLQATSIQLELVGLLLLTAFVFGSRRKIPSLLPIGWNVHAFWLAGHLFVTDAPQLPSWYLLFGISYDLVIAAYLSRAIRRGHLNSVT